MNLRDGIIATFGMGCMEHFGTWKDFAGKDFVYVLVGIPVPVFLEPGLGKQDPHPYMHSAGRAETTCS